MFPLTRKVSEDTDDEPGAEEENEGIEADEACKPLKEQKIVSERIGHWADGLGDNDGRLIKLARWLRWQWERITWAFSDFKRSVRNHIKWHKAMKKLYPWEGFDGLFTVTRTHLEDYLLNEEAFGRAMKVDNSSIVASLKETIELLERMRDHDEYISKRWNEVRSRYPKYGSHIREYIDGSSSFGGDFVAQGSGWAGAEAGKEGREGYFEFVEGKLELVASPDQHETNKLLEDLHQYHREIQDAFDQAEKDLDEDFDRLHRLLKENLYTWWN